MFLPDTMTRSRFAGRTKCPWPPMTMSGSSTRLIRRSEKRINAGCSSTVAVEGDADRNPTSLFLRNPPSGTSSHSLHPDPERLYQGYDPRCGGLSRGPERTFVPADETSGNDHRAPRHHVGRCPDWQPACRTASEHVEPRAENPNRFNSKELVRSQRNHALRGTLRVSRAPWSGRVSGPS